MKATLMGTCGLTAILAIAGCGRPADHAQGASGIGWETGAVSTGICPGAATVNGIDVSEFQRSVDWSAVKGAGYDFAIARVSDGTSHLDGTFDGNWSGIASAGLLRGAYQFFEPGEDAVAQANLVVQKVGRLGPGDLPVMLDMEVTGGRSGSAITASIHQWVDTIQAGTGKTPFIYTGAYFWDGSVGSADFANLALDVAWYGTRCPGVPNAWGSNGWTFHQYSSSGQVPGVSANPTDLDVFNGTLAQLQTFAGKSTSVPLGKQYVAVIPTLDGQGYWILAADGGVFSFGTAQFYGSLGGQPLNQPIVGGVMAPDGHGYWLVAADGGVFSFGSAAFHGSTGGIALNAPVVGMAATPDGNGYWLVAADGGVFAFGSARFYGSTGGMKLNAPVVGMAATRDGLGYWLVAADGGVFAFGSAPFYGSAGALHLNAPVTGMAVTADGKGYWLVAQDGGIFSYGTAPFFGSAANLKLNAPMVGIATVPAGTGYVLIGHDGGIFAFGQAGFFGSRG
jgi:GH25 family lysozyme M1 (1,4-beta-N-acetylmuramidase)